MVSDMTECMLAVFWTGLVCGVSGLVMVLVSVLARIFPRT